MTVKDNGMPRTGSQEARTEPRLLTVPEAAARMNATQRFVRQLIFERRIAYTKLGRLVRISEADIDRYIESNRIEAAQ